MTLRKKTINNIVKYIPKSEQTKERDNKQKKNNKSWFTTS